MDGLPALELWDIVIQFYDHTVLNERYPKSNQHIKMEKHTQTLVETLENIMLANYYEWITFPAAHNLLKGFLSYTFRG